MHTIKGTCGFLGLPRLEHVAHAAENVLGKVRDKELTATTGVVTAVLAGLDRIKLIVAGLASTGVEQAGDDTALIAMLNRAASGEAPESERRRRAQVAPVTAAATDKPAADARACASRSRGAGRRGRP